MQSEYEVESKFTSEVVIEKFANPFLRNHYLTGFLFVNHPRMTTKSRYTDAAKNMIDEGSVVDGFKKSFKQEHRRSLLPIRDRGSGERRIRVEEIIQ
jgi:hypothetical protein